MPDLSNNDSQLWSTWVSLLDLLILGDEVHMNFMTTLGIVITF